jgi:predicted nucleotide-binding protein
MGTTAEYFELAASIRKYIDQFVNRFDPRNFGATRVSRGQFEVAIRRFQRDDASLFMLLPQWIRKVPLDEQLILRSVGEHQEVLKDKLDEDFKPLLQELARRKQAENAAAQNAPVVFVVHGRNHSVRDEVADLLRTRGFTPRILENEPNMGRTVIEKFEGSSQVEFVVVVMTPDDIGGVEGGDLYPRARQNVILELGFFIGKLGRMKVAALHVEGVELPSDVQGVLYTRYDGSDGAWRQKLLNEITAAGVRPARTT